MDIVILAGGVGKRLWPMSNQETPKQFLALVSNKSMLQDTYDRVKDFADNIYVSTSATHAHLVKEQLPDLAESHIITEPSTQDTAPSMGLAAAIIAKENPDAVMATISADHLLREPEKLAEKLKLAAEIAKRDNTLNIVEVEAKSPDTSLGYVEIGEELESGVYSLVKFTEKPDLETAKAYIAGGKHLWNTGFYVWKVSTLLEAFKEHQAETYEHLMAIQSGEPIEEHYPKCTKISIDYGIMEQVNPSQVRIISADFAWSDLGTWAALHDELSEDNNNVEKGDVLSVDSEGCLIYNQGQDKISTLGLKDIVIVNANGHTLVCHKSRAADLKKLLEKLNG
ncbi:mannose-1-phosphate guanylyltransferase [Candidatus Peregrinibacteria bacterium]|jgi:mannose-1-phosphate guanylyltransferase|nr:mannose-1-phosphate guanylyltransferase [Candidatus Peregrinibacteria bacterium]MBT4632142.1 mannose-1-phosphate guanylyltransferase [Candidatus Peregrinibacteria bacterium]MBT5517065.1 mannose-1-phosphate guanylyltransferase [Candidatus Peregrinibacteria bacterium]MBT5824060.1 mannose-1-phosphate guanylyltransferase [Candidatus Peregrinibacteria bacterium]